MESCPAPDFTFSPDFTFVCFNYVLGDGQAEPSALSSLIALMAALIKLLENVLYFLRRDAGTSIGDPHFHFRRAAGPVPVKESVNADCTSLGRKL